jgi:hypothetical protein
MKQCDECGKSIRDDDKFCLACCGNQTPEGPPLKRCRKYGFRVTYSQRHEMNLAREITGAIPTDAEASSGGIKMSHLYVACNGKTYIRHEWIERGGSSCSWSEPYVPNSVIDRTSK